MSTALLYKYCCYSLCKYIIFSVGGWWGVRVRGVRVRVLQGKRIVNGSSVLFYLSF